MLKYRLSCQLICKSPVQASISFCIDYPNNLSPGLDKNNLFLASGLGNLSLSLQCFPLLPSLLPPVSIPLSVKFQLLIFIFKARPTALYRFLFSLSVNLLANMYDRPKRPTFHQSNLQANTPPPSLSLLSTVGRIFRPTYNYLSITFTITISPYELSQSLC